MRAMLALMALVGVAHAEEIYSCDQVSRKFGMNSDEYRACEAKWTELAKVKEQARLEAIANKQREQQAAAADPRTPVLLATAAYLAFQDLRRAALEEIKEQKRYAKVGGVTNRQVMWVLQERLRYADRGIRAYKSKAKAQAQDEVVVKLRACFSQYPDEDTGPCAEEIVSRYTGGNSPMGLN